MNETPSTRLTVQERQILPVESFQAEFYSLEPNGVIKVYGTNRVAGGVPLDDPEAREKIIRREVQVLQQAAPDLQAQLVSVVMPDGTLTEGIMMIFVAPNCLVENLIQLPESRATIDWILIAQSIADYHANQELCPPVNKEYNVFLTDLLINEITILCREFPDETHKYQQWRTIISYLLRKYQPQLNDYGHLFNDPVLGHGDIKCANLAIINQRVNLMDPAPIKIWQIEGKRMGASFLRIELELQGLQADADKYWQAYDQAWKTQYEDTYSPERHDDMLEMIDQFNRLYRYLIFYRLSKNSTTPSDQKIHQQCEQGINNILEIADN